MDSFSDILAVITISSPIPSDEEKSGSSGNMYCIVAWGLLEQNVSLKLHDTPATMFVAKSLFPISEANNVPESERTEFGHYSLSYGSYIVK